MARQALDLSGESLDYPISFYQDEWSHVVCAQDVATPGIMFRLPGLAGESV